MKVVFATPTYTQPHPAYLKALENSVPLLDASGIEHQTVFEVGSPYISAARATLTRKALDTDAEAIVYIDHDVAWRPEDLLALITTPDDVVAGTYRFKKDEEEYMGSIFSSAQNTPTVREKDGALYANAVPAGFLKITRNGIRRFMKQYPHLLYGHPERYTVDLFNHGAHNGVWYGEDYAFSRNWRDMGGEIILLPDLNLDHHSADKCFEGNFHMFLRRQPGGDLCPLST
jgi:hypothetical protein